MLHIWEEGNELTAIHLILDMLSVFVMQQECYGKSRDFSHQQDREYLMERKYTIC